MTTDMKAGIETSSLDEIVKAVSGVYCPHLTTLKNQRQDLRANFHIIGKGSQPIVELRYGAPVRIDAGRFPRLMLLQGCLGGAGTATQANVTVACRPGETLPLSAGLSTQLEFDGHFAQRSMRLDLDRLEALCARMLNHELDRRLRFELRPFSRSLEQTWSQTLGLIMTYESMTTVLPRPAATGLEEFALSLVLQHHPHNYTSDLLGRTRSAPPKLIREAEHLMRAGDAGLTVSQIASHLGVSLRSLEAGFHEYRRTTPISRLREIRLQQVRRRLLEPDEATSVTSVALENGFLHLPRFSSYYRAAFGETPSATLQRNRMPPRGGARKFTRAPPGRQHVT
jgi:AraC-like DNA-binding protein